MTLAQTLLLPITALMLVDMRQTLHGLRNGLHEQNGVAAWAIQRFGLLRGMLFYEAGILVVFGGMAIAFPSQWALQLLLLTDLAVTVNSNRRLLRPASAN